MDCKYFAIAILAICLGVASASPRKLHIKINADKYSAVVEFKPLHGILDYVIEVENEDAIDAEPAVFEVSENDLVDHEFYEVTVDGLEPGTHYEVEIFNADSEQEIGEVDFFTNCADGLFQCLSHVDTGRPFRDCLRPKVLCDTYEACYEAEEEKYNICKKLGPCMEERELSLQEKVNPPECQENGDFKPLRCKLNDSYCYCVDVKTGEYIGTDDTISYDVESYLKCKDMARQQAIVKPPLGPGYEYLQCPPGMCEDED